jgi:hypothetical protein
MKFVFIVIVAAVLASIATVAVGNVLGYEVPAWLSGAVGGAVSGGVVSAKVAQKSDAE